jgi:predicted phage-related endonuclease
MDIEQGTEEWFEARLGLATASHFQEIIAKTKSGGYTAGRKNYRAQLVAERITGRTPDRFQTGAMGWGTDTEDLAAMSYALVTGNGVTKAGFMKHSFLAAGASPDRLVGDDGGVEIKCPNSATHIETLKTQEVPAEYIAQVQGNLWIFDRAWWDFVSFDPDMPENAQLFIKRVYRDEEYINNLKVEVSIFLDEVDAEEAFIKAYEGAL